jgi:uncharacterized membrane protein
MLSRASIAGHPIHPMLIPLPIGLWVFSLVADLIFRLGWGDPVWNDVAFYTLAGGIVGALLAAIPGVVDLLAIRDDEARRIGASHLTLNLTIVALFALNLWLRVRTPAGAGLPLLLSVLGVALLGVSGWLGWEMISRYGVGVSMKHEARIRVSVRQRERGRAAS